MTHTADAVIIGAGIIGCAVSFELAKKGYKVVNVDKLPDAGYGSTSNSCAIVRFHYSTYQGILMAHEGYFYWTNWADYLETEDERGYAKFRRVGIVMMKTEPEEYGQIEAYFQDLGVPFEIWDNATLQARLPVDTGLYGPPKLPGDEDFWNDAHGVVAGATFMPQGGYVTDPQLATHNLMRAAEAKGSRFLFNAAVSDIRQANGRAAGVTLKDGTLIDAPIVVNVAGPHSFIINRLAGVEAGMKVKTKALRHEVHTAPSPKGFDYEQAGMVAHCGDDGVYVRPEVGNSLIVGSSDPACDPKEWIEDPDSYNTNVTEARWQAQVYRLAKRMPDLGIPNRPKGVADLYDVSDDWLPVYDKSDLPGFYMAVGTSGNQFKNGGPVGHLMAELIEACENGRDHDRDPVQVKCRYKAQTMNAGFYSRLREINPESSFSVMG